MQNDWRTSYMYASKRRVFINHLKDTGLFPLAYIGVFGVGILFVSLVVELVK